MLDPEIYMKLTELCYQKGIKSLSKLVNHIIKDYFRQLKTINEKEKVIEKLQNVITELGERAEGYKNQLLESD
jgi:hypothetical protein